MRHANGARRLLAAAQTCDGLMYMLDTGDFLDSVTDVERASRIMPVSNMQ